MYLVSEASHYSFGHDCVDGNSALCFTEQTHPTELAGKWCAKLQVLPTWVIVTLNVASYIRILTFRGSSYVQRTPACRCDCEVSAKKQHPLCYVNQLLSTLAANESKYRHKKGTLTLIVAGHDDPKLSVVKKQAEKWVSSGWFKRIFFEGGDIHVDGIDTYFKVLDQHYLLGRRQVLAHALLLRVGTLCEYFCP